MFPFRVPTACGPVALCVQLSARRARPLGLIRIAWLISLLAQALHSLQFIALSESRIECWLLWRGALETHGRGQDEVRQQVEGLRTLFDSLDTQGLGMVAVDDLMKLFGTSSKCRSFALGCAPQNVVTNFHNQGKRVPLGVTGA